LPDGNTEATHTAAAPPGRRLRGAFDWAFPVAYAVVFALVAWSVHARFFPIGGIGVESDFFSGLVPAAKELWSGSISIARYPYKGPFYSVALVFVHMFGGDWYENGVLLNVLCAAGSLIVLYRLLLRTFGRRVAVVATISTSLVAKFFVHAHKASSDMLFFLLCFLAISLLLMKKRPWLALAGSGVLSALAFLTRYNGAFLPAVALIVILFMDSWRGPVKRRVASAAVYIAAFVLVCAPWLAFNLVETGSLLQTDNLRNVVEEFYRGARAADIPSGGFTSVGSMITHDPAHFAGHYLLNIPRHFWADMLHALGIEAGILVMLGLLRLLFVPPTRKQWAFLSFGVGYFLSMCLVFYLPRFSLLVIPMYLAVGFSLLVGPHDGRRSRLGEAFDRRFIGGWRRLVEKRPKVIRTAIPLVIAGLLLMQVQWIVRAETFHYSVRPLFVLPAARFLKEHAGGEARAEEKIVMARKAHVAYYAGTKYRMYPHRVLDGRELVAAAIELGADYVVYSRLEHACYPDAKWLGGLESEFGVERIYSEQDITIYELAGWLDLGSREGAAGLEERLARLESFDRAGRRDAVMRTCAEIALLYSYNRDLEKAGNYLLSSLEVAVGLPDAEDRNRGVRVLRSELARVADAFHGSGRHAEGAALIDEAQKLIGGDSHTGSRPGGG
jgi:4-amino-4-deoxy-L-arabinose transferase-like glycosyltransferase